MTQVCVHSTNAKHLTHTLHCFGCWGFISERNKKTNKNLSSRRLINKKMREEDEADTLKAATPPGEEQSTGLLRLQSTDLGRGAERHRGDKGGEEADSTAVGGHQAWGQNGRATCSSKKPPGEKWPERPQGGSPSPNMRLAKLCYFSLWENKDCFSVCLPCFPEVQKNKILYATNLTKSSF